MIQKVLKVGNSLGVTFPIDFVTKNKIKSGSFIAVTHSNGSITFSPKISKSTKYETVSDKEFLGLINDIESEYGDLLDDLANL